MTFKTSLRAFAAALALGLAACSGSNIASPGATNSGTPPGGGTGGGGTGGGGTGTCPAGTTNAGALAGNTVCNVTGEILTNLTLPRLTNIVYRLNGRVDIGRDVGAAGTLPNGVSATLTVEPGVRIFGDVAGDMLVVNRGSRINAVGTVAAPIVFTGKEDIEGLANATTSNRLWGGVIVLGRAPIRGCNTGVAQGSVDCQNAIEGVTAATGRDALYGGATTTDNSGVMRYVQIRYPGEFLSSAAAGDDLNGLTLGGVGNGADFSFIQVHNSGDDGVEIFGGSLNLRNIVLTGMLDDSLDYDDGWNGNLQFLAIRQTALTGGPDRLIEASNIARANSGGSLNTNPTIANFTLVGVRTNSSGANLQGASLNNTGGSPGSSGRYANGVVTGSNVCLAASSANTSPAPTFNSVVFDCPTAPDATSLGFVNAGANNSTNVASSLTGLLPGPVELGRTAVNTTTLGAFFQSANYVGAFSPTETATSNWTSGWTIELFPVPGCPTGTTESGTVAGQRRCIVSGILGQGTVPANLRLTAGNIYQLSGRVDVGVDLGANPAAPASTGVAGTLTIDAGTTLYGNTSADMIVVNRGSRIFVNGTRQAPVIMTSLPDVSNSQVNPATASREWAGLILLGRAPIRGCNTGVARGSVDCQREIEGVPAATGRSALYGGATANDNSGRISHLQIRYPGAFLTSAAAGDDLNGLTLGGVGSGTEINFVQVHNSGDDGIEIFGGTNNFKYFVITGALDDSLDYDDGWTGKAQFGIITQYLTQTGGPDRMVEASNFAGVGTGTLDTNPIIANFTFVGIRQNAAGANLTGVTLNNTGGTPGSSGRFLNGVVTGSNTCLNASSANTSPAPTFSSVLFDCPGTYDSVSAGLISAGTNNSTTTANTLTGTFINGATENGRTAVNPATVDAFFTATTYIGAVQNSSDTWWQSWTCGLQSGSSC